VQFAHSEKHRERNRINSSSSVRINSARIKNILQPGAYSSRLAGVHKVTITRTASRFGPSRSIQIQRFATPEGLCPRSRLVFTNQPLRGRVLLALRSLGRNTALSEKCSAEVIRPNHLSDIPGYRRSCRHFTQELDFNCQPIRPVTAAESAEFYSNASDLAFHFKYLRLLTMISDRNGEK
jgi:hypothetical protein